MAAHPGSSLDSEMSGCIFHLPQEGGRDTEQTCKVIFGEKRL